MATWFITGASRGIGLALTDVALQNGHTVFAGARNPDGARPLWELEDHYGKTKLYIVEWDVLSEHLKQHAEKIFSGKSIDVLVNNAGIANFGEKTLDLSPEIAIKDFNTNVCGTMRTTSAVHKFLNDKPFAKIAQISTLMASIADNTSGGAASYRMSKTALNMYNKCLAVENQKWICLALHPGWVKTDMGGPHAKVEVTDSARGLYKVIEGAKPSDSGHFFDFEGKELSW